MQGRMARSDTTSAQSGAACSGEDGPLSSQEGGPAATRGQWHCCVEPLHAQACAGSKGTGGWAWSPSTPPPPRPPHRSWLGQDRTSRQPLSPAMDWQHERRFIVTTVYTGWRSHFCRICAEVINGGWQLVEHIHGNRHLRVLRTAQRSATYLIRVRMPRALSMAEARWALVAFTRCMPGPALKLLAKFIVLPRAADPLERSLVRDAAMIGAPDRNR